MKKVVDITKFINTFKEKCSKENANFDKEYNKIKNFKEMEKDDYLFALQDANTFKEEFLKPHYKLYNLLQVFNLEVEIALKEKLEGKLLSEKIKYLKKMRREMANSRIEIYFCNVSNNQTLKPFANATMPYGLIHVGLMIDDVAIQWGRSRLGKSLIIPSTDVIYDDYIFAIEIENKEIWRLIKDTFNNLQDYLTKKKDYNTMGTLKAFDIADRQLSIIADESVKYNTKKDYNLVFKNCQHFADKVLKKLELSVDKSGEAGKVLNMAMDKLNRFDFSFKGKDFKTRADLDNYISINDFRLFSKDERRVLLCYRNVFDYWARVHPDDDKYKSTDMALNLWNELAEREKFL